MSVDHNFHVGPYIKVKTRKIGRPVIKNICPKGHESDSRFCPKCGGKVDRKETVVEEYTTWLNVLANNDDIDDILSVAIPDQYDDRDDVDTLIVVGNAYREGLHWQKPYIDGDATNIVASDIGSIVAKFEDAYRDGIDMLRASDYVESVEVKFGYFEWYS